GADLPAAQADRLDRVAIAHDPAHLVQAVDVLLDVEIARQPGEVQPVAHLPFHVAPALFPGYHPQGPGVVGALKGGDFADGAVQDALEGLAHAGVVAPAQAGDDGQALLAGFLDGLLDRTHAGSIHGDRFLDKRVFAGGDGFLEVDGPEAGRRR